MKKLITTLAFVFFIPFLSHSQVEKYPRSYFELGAGHGQSYGATGFKFLVGYKGTGLTIGSGIEQGLFMSKVGFQITYKIYSINIGSGSIGTYKVGNTSEIKRATGQFFVANIRPYLNHQKTIFLEAGVGFRTKKRYRNKVGEYERLNGMTALIGVGFSIG